MNWTEWVGLAAQPENDVLVNAVLTAHRTAALQNHNVSSAALSLASSVKTPFPQSVAAALMTLGGPIHGPTRQAREMIYGYSLKEIREELEDGSRIPGWGNAFFKDELDPAWTEVDAILRTDYETHAERLDEITELVSEVRGRTILPNAAGFTAVTSHIVNMPLGLEIMFLIIGRLPAWAAQYMSAQSQ